MKKDNMLLRFRNYVYFFSKINIGVFRNLPVLFAKILRLLCKDNKTSFELSLKTYDGSNQVVHPDFLVFNDLLVMAYTPYPLGCDFFENPSISIGKDIKSLKSIRENPISKSIVNKPGCHCCDPCLGKLGKDNLILLWIDVLNLKDKRECNLYCSNSYDAKKWTKPQLLKTYTVSHESCEHYLCPAFVSLHNKNFLYLVHWNSSGNTELIYYKDESFNFNGQFTVSKIKNIPKGYQLWHINICFNKTWDKVAFGDETSLIGLFLIRTEIAPYEYKLYIAKTDSPDGEWICDYEIVYPEEVKIDAANIYKSSINPQNGNYVVSYRDKNHCWKFCELPKESVKRI